MNNLLAFPYTHATSDRDPNLPLPVGLLELYRAMLHVRGIDFDMLDNRFPMTPCEEVRLSMMVERYETLRRLGAIHAEPHRTIAAKPSRQAFIRSLLTMSKEDLYRSYRECVDDDGLAEIQPEWDDLIRFASQM